MSLRFCHRRFLAAMILFGFISRTLPTLADDGKVLVQIPNVRSDQGEVFCSIYASKFGFPEDPSKATALVHAKPVNKQAQCEFSDLHEGDYAIAIYHDENGNGKLDRSFMGIPSEGIGFSNDAKGFMGPASFESAHFHFSGNSQPLVIHLRY